MPTTVNDISKLYPLSKATLIAGKQGLNRIVKSANIQEVPNVEQWLKGGEVLFTAGYAFKEIDNFDSFIRQVYNAGASAIFFKPGQYLTCIPEEMVLVANEIGLPLYELPKDIAYMDCILPIFEFITGKQVATLRRTENFHNELTQSMIRQEGLDGICNILHQATGQDVMVLDPYSTGIIARCETSFDEFDGFSNYVNDKKLLFDFIENNINTNTFRSLSPNRNNILYITETQKYICVPIHVQNKCIAYLFLDCSYYEISDIDMIAIEHACSLIALEIIQEQSLIEQEQKIQEKLLEDILMTRYTDEPMLYRRGISMGIDLTKPYIIFTIDPYEFEAFVNSEMKDLSEFEVQEIKNTIHDAIYSETTAWRHPKLLLSRSVRVIGYVSILSESDTKALCQMLNRIIIKLHKIHPKLHFNIGISRIKNDYKQAADAEKESFLAVTCGNLPQYKTENGIVNFDDLGALRFLIELSDSEAMHNFYEEHIKVLQDYDRDHDADLLNTLECFFECNKNHRETADRLYIHKNSVVYRIKKIESLTGISLSDGQSSFDLQICLLLKKLM